MTISPGYYPNMPMREYLADPCPTPSLSTSTAEDLFYRSALHAHAHHPKLGKRGSGDDSTVADVGSAAHSLVFGGAPVQYVETVTKRSGPEKGQQVVPRDWLTKDAQEAQAAIREAGGIPMLPHQREQIEGIANSARYAISMIGVRNLVGIPQHEVTMLWQMHGVWCRGRADYLDKSFDIDLKTVDDADPHDFMSKISRRVLMQKGLRSLGHKALGQPRTCLWLLVEREYPHASSFVALDPAKLALAERRAEWSAKRWAQCLASNEFTGYGVRVYYAEPKPWEETEIAERLATKGAE